MTACLTYAPLPLALAGTRPAPAAVFLSGQGSTGVSNASRTVRRQTTELAISYLGVLSFSLPLEVEFEFLAVQWKEDTRFCSSPEIAAAHPSYKRIIGMGLAAVPLILEEIKHEPGLWFDALMSITGEQPVSEDHAGDIEAMCRDWISWGRRNGLI